MRGSPRLANNFLFAAINCPKKEGSHAPAGTFCGMGTQATRRAGGSPIERLRIEWLKEREEALRPGNGAVETEGARLEIDRPREHDAYDEQPEHASTGTQQQGRAARMGGGAFSRNRLTKGMRLCSLEPAVRRRPVRAAE